MLFDHLEGCFLSVTIHDAPVTEIAAFVMQMRVGCEDLPGYGASGDIVIHNMDSPSNRPTLRGAASE